MLACARRRRVFSHQVEFATIQQFPLHLLTRLQPDSRRQRDGKVDVELWILPFGSNGLHF